MPGIGLLNSQQKKFVAEMTNEIYITPLLYKNIRKLGIKSNIQEISPIFFKFIIVYTS